MDLAQITEINTVERIITIMGIGLWVLFPIGMFISVAMVDKNTDQLVRLGHYRELDEEHLQPPQKSKSDKTPWKKDRRKSHVGWSDRLARHH